VATPEKYPTLRDKYGPTLNYTGNVVQSCIHCHQIGDAQRQAYRSRKEPIPVNVLLPHPHPKSIGLVLDPKEKATVLRVEPRSVAEAAGFAAGDAIRRLDGQPLLSIADVQWVLHRTAPEGGTLVAEISRAGTHHQLELKLPKGWRHADDLSWRSTAWGLRRMATGGLLLETVSDEERTKLGVAAGGLALRVKHVGQYGPHAAGKQAGFRVGDVLISFDNKTDFQRESDLLAYAVTARKPGDQVSVTILREGQKLMLMLPMQE
jgi:S1-C subfamily serine protease